MDKKKAWKKAAEKNRRQWNVLLDYAYGVAEECADKSLLADHSLTALVKYTDLFSPVEKALVFNTAKRIMLAKHSEELLMEF